MAENTTINAMANETLEDASNETQSNTSPVNKADSLFDFSVKFRLVVIAICIVVGIICNFLALMVFCRPSMRKTTSSLYLAALACADSIVLISEGKSNKVEGKCHFGWCKVHSR